MGCCRKRRRVPHVCDGGTLLDRAGDGFTGALDPDRSGFALVALALLRSDIDPVGFIFVAAGLLAGIVALSLVTASFAR